MYFFQTILQATLVNSAKKHKRLLFKFFYTSIMITKNITSTGFFRNAAKLRVPMLMTSNSIIHCVHVHKGRNKEAANVILGN